MNIWKTNCAAAFLAIAATTAHAGSCDPFASADKTGKFTELLEAAQLAGLTEKLKGEGPWTIFAPTDEAFEKLATFTEYLMQLENKQELAAILKNHIVPGNLLVSDLSTNSEPLSTLLDSRLQLDTSDGLRVANARIMETDLVASNGVIHTIDAVLEPRL